MFEAPHLITDKNPFRIPDVGNFLGNKALYS